MNLVAADYFYEAGAPVVVLTDKGLEKAVVEAPEPNFPGCYAVAFITPHPRHKNVRYSKIRVLHHAEIFPSA